MRNFVAVLLAGCAEYEDVYLKGYADGREARTGIAAWVAFYNPASLRPSRYVVEEKRFC